MGFFSDLKNSLNASDNSNPTTADTEADALKHTDKNETETIEPFSNIFRSQKFQDAKNKLKATAQNVVTTTTEHAKDIQKKSIENTSRKEEIDATNKSTTGVVGDFLHSEKVQIIKEKVKVGTQAVALTAKDYAKDIGEKVSSEVTEKKQQYDESKLLEDDETYWNKRATIGQYFYDIENGFIVPERLSVDSEDRYQLAVEAVGNVSFDQLFGDEKDYFAKLDEIDLLVGIAIGASAVLVATKLDEKGKDIEKSIDSQKIKDKSIEGSNNEITVKEFDENNAFDLVSGMGHRKSGHGITSFMERIPADLKVKNQGGKTIAEITGCTGDTVSFWEYFNAIYSYDNLSKYQAFIEKIKHILVHFSKDIFTPDGIPLPFTEMLTKYVKKEGNKNGYSVQNKLLDKLGKGANSIKASDLTTPVYIKTLLSIYYKLRCEDEGLDKNAIKLKKAQLATLAYGTCLLCQAIMLVMAYAWGNPGTTNYSGARLNYTMAMILIKNIVQIEVIINKEQKKTLQKYTDLIESLGEYEEIISIPIDVVTEEDELDGREQ